MTDPDNASGRLVNTLKVLRVIYAVVLVPLVFFSLFGLFIFIVAITEKSLRDWVYFFPSFAVTYIHGHRDYFYGIDDSSR